MDTDHCYFKADCSVSLVDSTPREVLAFIQGLKCPRCREFVVLRCPQSIDEAFLAASQFELCYSELPAKKITDNTALNIVLSRSEEKESYSASVSQDCSDEEEGSAGGGISEAVKGSEYNRSSTAYFNSLLGRLHAAGVSKHTIDQYRMAFNDLHRNYFADPESGVREEEARHYLFKHRKYKFDAEKHKLHEYETHMTIKLAACTRIWHVGIKIPILAIQIKKPTWMRRLFHKLPVILSSPGISYNT